MIELNEEPQSDEPKLISIASIFWKLFGTFTSFGIICPWVTYWLTGHNFERGPDMILPCILTVGVVIFSYLTASNMVYSVIDDDDME